MALALADNSSAPLHASTASLALYFFQQAAADAGVEDTRDFVLSQIRAKMSALERWNSSMPGYGGFLPWFTVNATTAAIEPLGNWAKPYRVSAAVI